MTAYAIHDRLTRKYLQAPTIMVDPYTVERDGAFYLTSDSQYRTAILCSAIVEIEEIQECGVVESFPIGYDETQETVCTLPRGHAGDHYRSAL